MALDFTKPTNVRVNAGFEGGPDGGYVPQMSQSDAEKWKAKLFNAGKPDARVEVRKSLGGVQMLIIVGRDGWNYSAKHETADRAYGDNEWRHDIGYAVGTRGKNVRVSMNGPAMMSWNEFQELLDCVEEAKRIVNGKKE